MFTIPSKLDNKIFDELPKSLAESICVSYSSNLPEIINSSVTTETKLIKIEKNRKIKRRKLQFIRKTKIKLRENNVNHKIIIEDFIRHYLKEINANFRLSLFPILEFILPIVLNFLFYTITLLQFFKNFLGQAIIRKKIIIRGNKNLIRSLDKKGALVFVPTHVSHIDSLVVAYALLKLKVKPPIWGAGLNLFTNFFLSFLMNSVGCYKIDRRKKNILYLETLKEYSTYQISKKQNSLFYPGGTRSRTGGLETKLKLGLLGTVTKAFLGKVKENKEQSEIYIVPITLSYSVVPEAECLSYENFFGKIKHKRMLRFLQRRLSKIYLEIRRYYNLMRLNSHVYCTFGDPIDPLGNNVNTEGVSIDSAGVPVDFKKPIDLNDLSQAKKLTIQLGEVISNNYFALSTVIPTQIFLYAIVEYITLNNPGLSDAELVRLNNDDNIVTKLQLKIRIKRIIKKLKEIQKTKGIALDPIIEIENVDKIIELGIDTYTKEYNAKPITINGDYVVPNKIPLIWYYSDRIRAYLSETKKQEEKKWSDNYESKFNRNRRSL